MGELKVDQVAEGDTQRAFTRRVLDDLEALERMLKDEMFETGIRRIGAEQEMFLVDAANRPAPVADEVLAKLPEGGDFTTELARFNLEYNAAPRVFGGRCLSELEEELHTGLAQARAAAQACDADVLLTGILPTLRQDNLHLGNMTPRPRYRALNDVMTQMRGGAFRVALTGIDEIEITHDNVMLEACNTSFQVHFQVAPDEFAKLYNIAQAVTAPVLAAAVNSPVLLAHRLWSETRVGLFQQSVDERSHAKQARGTRPRVSFGDRWVDDSVLEIFREDVARFRILVANAMDDDTKAMDLVLQGKVPLLRALRLHNGTVYRWNRACYGISDGLPHLRVENRVLPAGPTVLDEVANAAFFFGLMSGFVEAHGEIREEMRFDDARSNFFSAARYGLKAQFHWLDGRRYPASELILDALLPMAREGLRVGGLDDDDADRYLDVIRQRTKREQTGAHWMVQSLNAMPVAEKNEARLHAVTAAIRKHQWTGEPVHTWPLASVTEQPPRGQVFRTVGQLMTREVFTVQQGDLVDLAASMMDWERVRHIPVEDDHGMLVGLLSHRDLLRLVARGKHTGEPVAVGDIMRKTPHTVAPETTTLDALELMRVHHLGCLPVVKDDRLVGIITERDFLDVTRTLLESELREAAEKAHVD